jgi:hypothetical protein
MTLTNWLIADAAFIALTAGFTGYAIAIGKDSYITINGLGMVLWFIIFLADLRNLTL